MEISYFDAHSHLHGKEYDTDRIEVLARMKESGVETIVVGTDKEESKKAVEFAEKTEGVWATIGQHPVDRLDEVFDVDFYRELGKSKKVVAIGECGLDYFRTPVEKLAEEKERQKKLFIEQVELSIELFRPLMIHCRPSGKTMDAHLDLLSILEGYNKVTQVKKPVLVTGNIHFFTGTLEVAKRYIELGFILSFPGIITFTKEYDEVIKNIPITSIISETDSPYATPVPFRGKRNEPTFVIETVKRIADIKEVAVEEMARAIRENVLRTFHI
jgi:TatD DNase family protein